MTATSVVAGDATCETWRLADFEVWMRGWNASADTIGNRLSMARMFARHWPDPTAVRPADISTFLANPTYSDWTKSTYHSTLCSLFGWLTEEGVIEVDPMLKVRRPRDPKRKPRPVTPDEADRLLDAAGAGSDLHTYLLLGLYAGMRAHEVAKIRGEDVTEDNIFVRGKGRIEALIPTHPQIWQAAQHYPARGFWFEGPREGHARSEAVTVRVTALFKTLGIDGSFHRCRHYYACSLLRAGVNLRVVQDLMRHVSLNTTAGYLDVSDNERTAAIRLLGASA